MAFISELLGKPVLDVAGQSIGTIVDIVASLEGGIPHPKVVAYAVRLRRGAEPMLVPASVLQGPGSKATLMAKVKMVDIPAFSAGPQDLFLARDLLDRQILDTSGARVVRVNDLEFAQVNGHLYVANVDIGTVGLMRRLGFGRIAKRVTVGGRGRPSAGVISWDDIELLPGHQDVRLRVSGDKVADLHPADLAEILSDLSRSESGQLLESMEAGAVADTLEEVEPDFQASLVASMTDEKVADVLGEMEPDEAADLLAVLPEDRSTDLLELMEEDEAEDVRRLLTYPEDSAGGIMTTQYVAVTPDLDAQQTISRLREIGHDAETIYYVYVVETAGRLVGVFSLRGLILASPMTPVADLMETRLVTVRPLDTQDAVARLVAKYDLLAVPVVDEQGIMHGIVTADDALDKVLPTAWKKRLPRLYH